MNKKASFQFKYHGCRQEKGRAEEENEKRGIFCKSLLIFM